jgi:hypothetical protein
MYGTVKEVMAGSGGLLESEDDRAAAASAARGGAQADWDKHLQYGKPKKKPQ